MRMLSTANMLSPVHTAAAFVCGAAALAGSNSSVRVVPWSAPAEAAGPRTLKDTVQNRGKREDNLNWHDVFDRRLSSVISLNDGWDGAASLKVNERAILSARHLLKLAFAGVSHPAPPTVMPGADGGLELAWYLNDVRFQFEIEPDGTENAWVQDRRSGREDEGEGHQARHLLFGWARQLTADKFRAA